MKHQFTSSMPVKILSKKSESTKITHKVYYLHEAYITEIISLRKSLHSINLIQESEL